MNNQIPTDQVKTGEIIILIRVVKIRVCKNNYYLIQLGAVSYKDVSYRYQDSILFNFSFKYKGPYYFRGKTI